MQNSSMVFFILFATFYGLCNSEENPVILNIMDFNATGDGEKDDSKAFTDAWEALCHQANGTSTLLVPENNTYLVQPLHFHGPCSSTHLHLQIEGKIVAPSGPEEWSEDERECWLCFANVSGLLINGSGLVDACGEAWWSHTKHNERPRAMSFRGCNNMTLNGLTHMNSGKNHISIHNVKNATLSNLNIKAPEKSPNTDGIDISLSTHVNIINSSIGTGDDCVAINGGSYYINITNVACGPGHGISVGSLGKDGANETVEHISVRNCSFNGTENGARIKTWEGGLGFARNILFENITLIRSKNPIIIDQHYCNGGHHCPPGKTAVKVSNVTYRYFTGASADEEAINLDCSEKTGCDGIVMEQINITNTQPGRSVRAFCSFASVLTKHVSIDVYCQSETQLPPSPAPSYPPCPTPSHPPTPSSSSPRPFSSAHPHPCS